MRQKSSKRVKKIQKQEADEVSRRCIIKIPFELNDYSEALTFDQIMDTMFIIGQYMNNPDHSVFAAEDIPAIEDWLVRNDIKKFIVAKQTALFAQAKLDESKEYAKEIMNMPLERKESWH